MHDIDGSRAGRAWARRLVGLVAAGALAGAVALPGVGYAHGAPPPADAAEDDPGLRIAPAPPVADQLRSIASALDDEAAFLSFALEQKVPCSGSLEWPRGSGRQRAVRGSASALFAGWELGYKLWNDGQRWVLQLPSDILSRCQYGPGTAPAMYSGYATVCPDPYPATIDAMRGDASLMRQMANGLDCYAAFADRAREQARERAEQKRAQALEEQKRRDEEKRAEEQRKAQEDANRRAQAERDRRAQAQEARERAEAERQAREARRHQEIAQRYAQEKAAADAANAQQAEAFTQYGQTIAGASGGNSPTGAAFLTHFGLGMAVPWVPLVLSSSGEDVRSSSNTNGATGLGVMLSLELWPFYWKYFGIGLGGRFVAASTAIVGGGSNVVDGRGGVRAFLGWETGLSLRAEYQYGWRLAITSMDSGGGVVDANSTGSASYAYKDIGGGLRLCLSTKEKEGHLSCEDALTVSLLRESPEYADGASTQIWRLAFEVRRLLDVFAELGLRYPAAGKAYYAGDTSAGTYFEFGFESSWDWFASY